MYFGKNKLNSFFQRFWPGALVVFSLSLLFSRWFWPTLTFTDPDSFYHVKITELLTGGIVRDFPWLPFTSLAEHFADHHFLYHVLLFPFIKFFGPFAGIKIVTVLIAAGALTTFYLVMRALRLRAPFFFTLILMTSASFMFRMHLAKAPAISLILVLLEVFAIVKSRPRLLGVLSFIHVWTHGSWPLPLIFAAVWSFGQRFFARRLITPSLHNPLFPPYLKGDVGLRGMSAPSVSPPYPKGEKFVDVTPPYDKGGVGGVKVALVGTIVGLIVNPHFPQNLAFYWTQIVQIAVVNFQQVVNVGAEWYPAGGAEFLAGGGLVLPVFALALVVFVFHAARITPSLHNPLFPPYLKGDVGLRGMSAPSASPSKEGEKYINESPPYDKGGVGGVKTTALGMTFGLVLLAVLAALMTVKSRRHLDYSMPMILMAASSLFTLAQSSTHQFIVWLKQYKFIMLTVGVLLLSLLQTVSDQLIRHRAALSDDHAPHELAGPLDFLMQNAPAGSVVFHTEWDDFPLLLYGAPHLRYIAGLDPLFFERHDPDRYKTWTQLSRAEWPTDPAKAIKEHFDARYIFLRKTDEALLGRLRFSETAQLIYEDESVFLWLSGNTEDGRTKGQ